MAAQLTKEEFSHFLSSSLNAIRIASGLEAKYGKGTIDKMVDTAMEEFKNDPNLGPMITEMDALMEELD